MLAKDPYASHGTPRHGLPAFMFPVFMSMMAGSWFNGIGIG
jgi:hypothetical protein